MNRIRTIIKYLFLICFLAGIAIETFAQAPGGINYQAGARDSKGKVLINKNLNIKTTILNGATSGTTVWSKEYAVKTDEYGIFSITLGDAASETAFASIDWGNGKYFLKVEILIGTAWTPLATSQLLSVPYAMFTKSAAAVNDGATKTYVNNLLRNLGLLSPN